MMPKHSSNTQPHSLSQAQHAQGFTLIELMIVLVLLGIVAAIAVPNFVQFMNNNRAQTLNQEVLAFLNFARSSAVTQRTTTAVCPTNTAWQVRAKNCTGTILRQLEIPASATVSSASSSFIFNYNGTSTAATITTCVNGEAANGYTIDIKSTGAARTYTRGKTSSGSQISSC